MILSIADATQRQHACVKALLAVTPSRIGARVPAGGFHSRLF
jgi:hypothetical protein